MKKSLPAIAVALVVLAAVFIAIEISGRRPDGPVEPSWDRESCAHCRMHVSERAFAAQIQDTDGRVSFFDDPGCLFAYVDKRGPTLHAVYFRHLEKDEWIAEADVAFSPVSASPMGYGLGAVRAGTLGTIPLEEARRRALDPHDPGDGHVPAH
ncbi:MAG: hypothetical protein IT350_03150 [Deltaproteobacteria bacterium]|nr:hypothetical protein [Deltaproteobacteria bacterium]